MQIVIPMSGFGERFRKAGFGVPKPLIEVENKPIIAHVIDLFPGEKDFIFVCNQDHLSSNEYDLQATLEKYCPSGRIAAIAPHKLGPIHAVLEATHLIDPTVPTIVNYCDFSCYWNYQHFSTVVATDEYSGAVACYRGFHPHMLRSTNYGYVKELNGIAVDYKEKSSFTTDPMSEFASTGTYYFRSGELMLQSFKETMDRGLKINNEYYVSLAYKPLIDAGHKISVYEVQHFMQWGTPEDLAQYKYWSNMFSSLIDRAHSSTSHNGVVLIPAAGLGSRFAVDGYSLSKPIIPVSGQPMIVKALDDLPNTPEVRVVLRTDLPQRRDVEEILHKYRKEISVITLNDLTDGQARTCLLGLSGISDDFPLTIGACDNGMIYDGAAFLHLLSDATTDVIVWGARGHPDAALRPESYGWIDAPDGDSIVRIAVKSRPADPTTDSIIVGAFTFVRAGDFVTAANRMIAREGRVNGEFYVDECINDAIDLGLKCRLFEIDFYLGWGTPNDLRSFQYWQSCFHKWPAHPYSLEKDRQVPAAKLESLEKSYEWRPPEWPTQNMEKQ